MSGRKRKPHMKTSTQERNALRVRAQQAINEDGPPHVLVAAHEILRLLADLGNLRETLLDLVVLKGYVEAHGEDGAELVMDRMWRAWRRAEAAVKETP